VNSQIGHDNVIFIKEKRIIVGSLIKLSQFLVIHFILNKLLLSSHNDMIYVYIVAK